MKRKLLSLFLACIMVLGLTPVGAFAEDPMTITVGSVEGVKGPGDTFDMTVTMANNAGFTNCEWIIDFDTDALQITDIKTTAMLLGGATVNKGNYDYEGRKLGFITFAAAETIEDDGNLFKVSFKVKNNAPSGDYAVNLINLNFKNIVGNPPVYNVLVAAFVPGAVTIEGAPVNPVDTEVDGDEADSVVNSVNTDAAVPTIDAKSDEGGAESHTIHISAAIAAQLENSGKPVKILTDVGEILLDADAAEAIFGAGGDIVLFIENADLAGYDGAFHITATADGDPVFTGDGDGEVTVTLYDVPAPSQGTHYDLYYIPGSGDPELVSGAVYDEDEETLTATLGHFSTYAYKENNDADYTVLLAPVDDTVAVGDAVEVVVKVASETETVYNAVDMTFSYDASKLTFDGTISGYTVDTSVAGKVRVWGYGTDKSTSSEGITAFTLPFTATASGTATVGIDEAYVDKSAHAIDDDAPAANYGEDAEITISGCAVTFAAPIAPWFTYDAVAEAGADYTFSAKDPHYNYTFTCAMDGLPITPIDNGDGTFTIKNVTGPIEVSASSRTGKYYAVTKTGTGAVDITLTDEDTSADGDQAQYAKDYTFSLDKAPGHSYTVGITIGGANYTDYAVSGGIYTIDGADVTGDIAVTATKTAGQYAVTFEGTAAGDFSGASNATAGTNYVFTLTRAEGYNYTAVAVTIDGHSYTLAAPTVSGSVYTYTIAGGAIDGDIVISADKTLDVTVKVNTYVALDGEVMYLVLASGTPGSGKTFTYGGEAMFLTDAYDFDGDEVADTCYACLVVTDGTFTAGDAGAGISTATGTATAVDYGKDVNMSGKVDINDAQLIYDMYNAKYGDFATVLMEKFLRADVNASMNLNVEDAAAVVAALK